MLSTNRFDKLPSQVHTPFKNIFVGNCKTVTTNHTVRGCRILTKTLEKSGNFKIKKIKTDLSM